MNLEPVPPLIINRAREDHVRSMFRFANGAPTSLYAFSDVGMADPACAALAQSMANAQALTLVDPKITH